MIEHHHADVSGGWLRAATFGAMDGLVTNVSLIAGVGGGGASAHTIVLTGLAGLARRAESVDGTLEIASPPGGPTLLTVDLPCAR